MRSGLLVLLLVLLAVPVAAQDEVDLDTLLETFGWDLAGTEIRSEQVGKGLHVLFGLGGNVAASIGEQGVLIVDDQFPELVPKIEAAIRGLGGDGVDFVINTHWHFDHAAGNLALGPAGAWIVSQQNSRDMMMRSNMIDLVRAKHRQEAYPPAALPTIAYDDRMQLHFNGERIDLIHAGPAHTTGDTAVLFRGHGAVHMGDVFNNSGYPFIDAGNGGGIDGVIAFCRVVLAELPEDAIVIPGHGAVTDVPTMRRYVDMLETVRTRVAALIAEGKTLEQAVAAKPTAEFDATYGDEAESMGFVDRVYTSLAQTQ